jgi:hypothetical protein
MGRKPRVGRSPEEKWQIVQEGIKSGKSQRRVITGSLRFCSISGRMKRNRERRQRLGGEALPRRKPRRTRACLIKRPPVFTNRCCKLDKDQCLILP